MPQHDNSTNKLTKDQQRALAQRILDDPPPELFAWLEAEGLTLEDMDRSPTWTYGGLASSLRAKGLFETLEAWRKEQSKLFGTKYGITGYQKVANGVIYRFAEAKARQWKKSVRVKRRDEEFESLPAVLRWVCRHPSMDPTNDPDALETKAKIEAYQRRCPAPDPSAVVYLNNCLAHEKVRLKLFDEVRAFLLEARKKKKEAPNQADEEGRKQILDMREQLQAQMEKIKGKAAV